MSARPAILLVGDTLNPGGTEGQFVEVACGLDRSRWDVHVTCLRAEGSLRARLDGAGIEVFSCGRGSLRPPRFLGAVRNLAGYLRRHRINLVHCFDFYSNALGVPAARIAGVPVIASQRDLGDLRPRGQRRLQHAALRFATLALVNSDAIRERLRRANVVPNRRIVVVRNGVDLTRFTPTPCATDSTATVLVGTAANLRPEKGIDDLLRAAALVRLHASAARFVIHGDGPMRSNLEALVTELGLGSVTRLMGHSAAIEQALKGLRIFVFPPRNEGFSNALLEAMAVGLPVVATSVGGNTEVIENERTGLLVAPGDPAGLAQAILRLIEKPAFARGLALEGCARVRAEFGMPRMLTQMEALYRSVLARRSA